MKIDSNFYTGLKSLEIELYPLLLSFKDLNNSVQTPIFDTLEAFLDLNNMDCSLESLSTQTSTASDAGQT
jgi:hypothetical protein